MKPREANTAKKLSMLKRDNIGFDNADILVSEKDVSIWPDSKITGGWIVLSKKQFNKMIDWYNKEQKPKP